VMGAIGQHDPGLIQLQIGTKRTAQTPHLPRSGDLGMVMLGNATVIGVNQGRVVLRVAGESYRLGAGESALVQADGFVQLGGPAQLEAQSGSIADGKGTFDEFRQMQQFSFPHSSVQTMITLATPPSDDPEDRGPVAESLTTPGTGAVAGGTPCTASCN
jgi:hypothetical protein